MENVTRVSRLVSVPLDVIELLLGFRVLFTLLGLDRDWALARAVFVATDVLAAPFRALLPQTAINGILIDWSALAAMLFYLALGYGLMRLFARGSARRP